MDMEYLYGHGVPLWTWSTFMDTGCNSGSNISQAHHLKKGLLKCCYGKRNIPHYTGYCLSKKSCPVSYSEYTLKIGQDFLDIQYKSNRIDVGCLYHLKAKFLYQK